MCFGVCVCVCVCVDWDVLVDFLSALFHVKALLRIFLPYAGLCSPRSVAAIAG